MNNVTHKRYTTCAGCGHSFENGLGWNNLVQRCDHCKPKAIQNSVTLLKKISQTITWMMGANATPPEIGNRWAEIQGEIDKYLNNEL